MDEKLRIKIAKRQDANRAILKIISDMVENQPDLRFHQILQALNITQTETVVIDDRVSTGSNSVSLGANTKQVGKDLFYEESLDTLSRIKG